MSQDDFECFWKEIREVYKSIGQKTGSKAEAKAQFLRAVKDIGADKLLYIATQQAQEFRKDQIKGKWNPNFKHVCRWLKYRLYEDYEEQGAREDVKELGQPDRWDTSEW